MMNRLSIVLNNDNPGYVVAATVRPAFEQPDELRSHRTLALMLLLVLDVMPASARPLARAHCMHAGRRLSSIFRSLTVPTHPCAAIPPAPLRPARTALSASVRRDARSARRLTTAMSEAGMDNRSHSPDGAAEWPCPASALDAGRQFLQRAATGGGRIVLAPDKDADGLSAGVLYSKPVMADEHSACSPLVKCDANVCGLCVHECFRGQKHAYTIFSLLWMIHHWRAVRHGPLSSCCGTGAIVLATLQRLGAG